MARIDAARPIRRRAPQPAHRAPRLDRARLPPRPCRRGTRRRARRAARRRQRVAGSHDGGAARHQRDAGGRAAHALLADRLPPRRRRPRSGRRASGGRIRVQDEGSQLAALALTRADAGRARASGGSTSAPDPAARPRCSPPKPSRAARPSTRTRSSRPARVSCARRSPGSRSRCEVTRGGRPGPRAARRRGAYDRILVDAPCTGLGALRRRPEARWRKAPVRRPGPRPAAGGARRRRAGRARARRHPRLRHVLPASRRDLGGRRRRPARVGRPHRGARRAGRARGDQRVPARPRRAGRRLRSRAAVAAPARHRRDVHRAAAPASDRAVDSVPGSPTMRTRSARRAACAAPPAPRGGCGPGRCASIVTALRAPGARRRRRARARCR